MITPAPLKQGDKIAVISPATIVKREYVEGAAAMLRDMGYEVEIMTHALGPADGSYAASKADRLSDFRRAWQDPEVKAVLCARGGYGAVHLLPHITDEELLASPKWLIGFSDISALHARLNAAGITSLHAPMAKHLTETDLSNESTASLIQLLTAPDPQINYYFAPDPRNRMGSGSGILRGGNLAVLSHLVGTPYDMFTQAPEGLIIFIEDISEAIYATERMMWQLYLSGVFANCRGLIVGSFTDSRPDRNFPDTASMIASRLEEWGLTDIPVAFNVPIGHTDQNLPMPVGMHVHLEVNDTGTRLSSIK